MVNTVGFLVVIVVRHFVKMGSFGIQGGKGLA